jgi:hypothetical protein
MRKGRPAGYLETIRAALFCVMLVVASLPQVANAHGVADPDASSVDLTIGTHSNPRHMASGRCLGGQECSVQAIFLAQPDGQITAGAPDAPYQSGEFWVDSWLMAFDPPPPRQVA